jgi:hypothetical protein
VRKGGVKNTILFDGVVLKLAPLILIALPILPLMGVTEEMVGWATKTNGKHIAPMMDDK